MSPGVLQEPLWKHYVKSYESFYENFWFSQGCLQKPYIGTETGFSQAFHENLGFYKCFVKPYKSVLKQG